MTSKTTNKFAPEVRERAVRMVFDHERDHPFRWPTVVSIAEKIGCVPQTLYEWVKKAEVNCGKRAGVPTEVADKVKALEREIRDLRQVTGEERIIGGRASLRRAIYMPALVAIRFNRDLREKYHQLVSAGKAKKVAITAVMRRIDILANTLLRDGRN